MGERSSTTPEAIEVNRAPVLTLWAAVVARELGFDRDEALTLGRAVAGLNAQAKGRRLGIFHPVEKRPAEWRRELRAGERVFVSLLGRSVPCVRTPEGIRALSGTRPIDPRSVERYLESKFGDALPGVTRALQELARALPRRELAERAYELYERFRPAVPEGRRGWGARGRLDLARIHSMARELAGGRGAARAR